MENTLKEETTEIESGLCTNPEKEPGNIILTLDRNTDQVLDYKVLPGMDDTRFENFLLSTLSIFLSEGKVNAPEHSYVSYTVPDISAARELKQDFYNGRLFKTSPGLVELTRGLPYQSVEAAEALKRGRRKMPLLSDDNALGNTQSRMPEIYPHRLRYLFVARDTDENVHTLISGTGKDFEFMRFLTRMAIHIRPGLPVPDGHFFRIPYFEGDSAGELIKEQDMDLRSEKVQAYIEQHGSIPIISSNTLTYCIRYNRNILAPDSLPADDYTLHCNSFRVAAPLLDKRLYRLNEILDKKLKVRHVPSIPYKKILGITR